MCCYYCEYGTPKRYLNQTEDYSTKTFCLLYFRHYNRANVKQRMACGIYLFFKRINWNWIQLWQVVEGTEPLRRNGHLWTHNMVIFTVNACNRIKFRLCVQPIISIWNRAISNVFAILFFQRLFGISQVHDKISDHITFSSHTIS